MKHLAVRLLRDDAGVIVTPEIIIITTVGVLSLIAGWNAVSQALAFELGDVANSVGSLNQSYSYRGLLARGQASCGGGGFADAASTFNVQTRAATINGSTGGGSIDIIVPAIETSMLVEATETAVEVAVPAEGLIEVEDVITQEGTTETGNGEIPAEEELDLLLNQIDGLIQRVEDLSADR